MFAFPSHAMLRGERYDVIFLVLGFGTREGSPAPAGGACAGGEAAVVAILAAQAWAVDTSPGPAERRGRVVIRPGRVVPCQVTGAGACREPSQCDLGAPPWRPLLGTHLNGPILVAVPLLW